MAELHNVVLFMYTEELNYDLCRKWMELTVIMSTKTSQIQRNKHRFSSICRRKR